MIAGIAIIGIFITTLGSALIDSRLNKNKATTIRPLTFTDEAKLLIKSKIDGLDNLNSKDVDALLSMIKNLHDSLQKKQFKMKSYHTNNNSDTLET